MTDYKLGDRGVTRDGRTLTCRDDRGDGFMFPLGWWTDSGIRWWTTRNGDCASNGIDGCRIIRRLDDAKVEPETAAAEVAKDEPPAPSTLRTPAVFRSEKHIVGDVSVVAVLSSGKVSLRLGNNDLSESDVAVLLRTIETVMEQARRAKEVVG